MKNTLMILLISLVSTTVYASPNPSSATKMSTILNFIEGSEDFKLSDITGIQRDQFSNYVVTYIQFTGTSSKFACEVPATIQMTCPPCARVPGEPAPKCSCSSSVVIDKTIEKCEPLSK